MSRTLLSVILFLMLGGCIQRAAPLEVPPDPAPERPRAMVWTASYYSHSFAGRLTANGERFDPNALTAAHKSLPFNTRVRVKNPTNGYIVIVRINDRGPMVKGRDIDLSLAAARRLGVGRKGVIKVEVEVLGPGVAPSSIERST